MPEAEPLVDLDILDRLPLAIGPPDFKRHRAALVAQPEVEAVRTMHLHRSCDGQEVRRQQGIRFILMVAYHAHVALIVCLQLSKMQNNYYRPWPESTCHMVHPVT